MGKPVELELTDDQAKKISDAFIKSKTSIMDRITEFEDVLADQNITVEEFNRRIEHDTEDEAAYKRLKLIAKCLNEGPLDRSKPWYYPVFNRDPGAGFGLASARYGAWTSDTAVGERLCYKSDELAIFAGKKFAHIYKPYILDLTKNK